jgi:hypothetical protein
MPVSEAEESQNHDLMFHEALEAAHAGDKARARDWLTRLLKERQDNVEYWIWMSAVVGTPKEGVFCLKEALRLDPQNVIARKGLAILGALEPDQSLVVPAEYQKRDLQSRKTPGDVVSSAEKLLLMERPTWSRLQSKCRLGKPRKRSRPWMPLQQFYRIRPWYTCIAPRPKCN